MARLLLIQHQELGEMVVIATDDYEQEADEEIVAEIDLGPASISEWPTDRTLKES